MVMVNRGVKDGVIQSNKGKREELTEMEDILEKYCINSRLATILNVINRWI